MQAYSPEIGPVAQLEKVKTFFEKTLDIWGDGWYYNTRSAPVAQLDRVSDYESEGRGFESLPAHQGNLLNGKLPFLFYAPMAKKRYSRYPCEVSAMVSIQQYQSPLGGILLAADEVGLVGLWFEGQKYFANTLPVEHCAQTTPILADAKRWLDIYFAGKEPDFLPPLHPVGSSFQQSVWKILLTIPYGQTITYGDIARQLAAQQGSRGSAQAVGGAVGHNKVSIIIPCHRVVGTNGSLTGYAGGIDKKIKLLELERTDMSRLFIPKKGAAL